MASASPITTPCVTCEKKAAGVFKCEGCSQAFCRQHVLEHRDALTDQLEEMMTDHNLLQQKILDETDDAHSPFLTHIDEWEKNSILKIQKIAEEKREQLRIIHKCRKGSSLFRALSMPLMMIVLRHLYRGCLTRTATPSKMFARRSCR